jgi:hypothetical protein
MPSASVHSTNFRIPETDQQRGRACQGPGGEVPDFFYTLLLAPRVPEFIPIPVSAVTWLIMQVITAPPEDTAMKERMDWP